MLVTVFSLSIFVNAGLLFSIQPLFTKMVLPLLGGTSAVWNTCLLFFQAVLLGGYLYAHVTSKYLGARTQAILHLTLLAAALLLLPIHIPASWSQPPDSTLPVLWLLGLLSVSLGLPFFLLSAGAPMLQRWFAGSNHPSAQNPYFLYAASNLGSFVSLLAYPFFIEPRLRISEQSTHWHRLYIGLLVLMGVTAVLAYLARRNLAGQRGDAGSAAGTETLGATTEAASSDPTIVPDGRTRARWILLSFVPSSMLIGVTTYLSTDIASAPFLWVIPLSLYLLTFVLVFARRPIFPRWLVLHAQLLLGLPLIVALCLRSESGILGPATLHLLAFFATAMMCHGELANLRPRSEYLTEYYLWMSLGGVLGGVFNVLLAPLLFNSLVEYPLALLLAFMLRPVMAGGKKSRDRIGDVLSPLLVGVGIWLVFQSPRPPQSWFAEGAELFLVGMMFVVFFFWKRPLRLALGTGAMYAAVQLSGINSADILMQDRSFFGMYRVRRVADNHVLFHGTTAHGAQSLDRSRRTEPLTYYHRGGPVSDVFHHLNGRPIGRVGIVGLGTGSLACYGSAEDSWTFYEIDPMVVDIARTPRWFTYLQDCAPKTDVVIGDARLKLMDAKDDEFDLLLVDAFSSDAVPVHLITREALALYLRKLRPDGLMIFHISNRFLDLAPVLTALANDANMAALVGERNVTQQQLDSLYDASRWIVMARDSSLLSRFHGVDGRKSLAGSPASRLWTDDYSDVLAAISK
jgi:SAM-dependent methyltransferase